MVRNNNMATCLNRRRFVSALIFLVVIAAFGFSQALPSKIRGYKVYKKAVSVKTTDGPTGSLKISTPSVEDVSFSGVKVAVNIGVDGVPETGRVDFLTFHDFKINGIPVTINEYIEPFGFKKGQTVSLPKPLEINVGTVHLLDAARKGTDAFRGEWTVTGRVFVFGKFKKYGMQFRRVVPVDIDLRIKNPFAAG